MSDAALVLAFGGVTVVVEALVMIFRGKGWGPLTTKLAALTVVITMIVYLAASTIPIERLTAAYALLAAIVGYIFGKQEAPE